MCEAAGTLAGTWGWENLVLPCSFHSFILQSWLDICPPPHPQFFICKMRMKTFLNIYTAQMKRDHPKTQIRLMPLVCADCLSVCFLFFFFHKQQNLLSLVGPRAVVSITVSASLLFCSWHQPCEPSPDSGEDRALWGFLSVLFAVGRGQVLFLGLSFPVLRTPAHHQLQSRWPCFCPERALGIMFRNAGNLRGDLEAAVSMYS